MRGMSTNARIAVALFALIGFVVAGIGAVEVWMESGIGWVQTSGTVVKSEVQRRIRPLDRQVYRRVQWIPRVTYTYEVGGESYTNDRMHAGIHAQDTLTTPFAAQQVLDRYPVGEHVVVYYDPKQPGRAALEVSAAGGWVLVGLGALILAGGGVFWVRQRAVTAEPGSGP
jgi:Protein of unknown function (DUF3592)